MNNNLLGLSLIIIALFFLFNNVLHMGFHVGHNHEGTHMNNMMEYEEHNDGEIANYEISPGKVVDKIKDGKDIIFLDVRTIEEHQEVHLENSLLLPVQKLSQQTLNQIGLGEESKDKEIIIYCRSGNRSRTAHNIMNSLGYTNIKSISGGMVHWQEDNYPFTETGMYNGPSHEGIEVSMIDASAKVSLDRILHDFGDVPQSKGVISTTFELTNTGTEDLNIGELSTSCGCTTAEISKKSISPGNSATLTVYFDPDFHSEPAGKLTRTVFIPTNDPSTLEAEVKITVDILEGQ